MFDRFRAFSPKQQIMLIAGLLAACCALLAAVWYLFLRTTYEPLFTNLRAADAATIVSDLERRKIHHRLSDGGTTISVPSELVDSTRLKVMTEDLPLKGTVGFELFNKSDMGLTDFAQKINYQRALQGELERTIMTLDGVAAARVHVSLGEDRLFRENQVPPKASATVRMAKGASLDPRAVLGIQRLIAAAIPKLDSADVVVLDEEGRVISPVPQPPAAEEVLSPALEQQRAIEEFYAARIRQALASAYPLVAVSVDASSASGPGGVGVWNSAARAFPLHVKLAAAELIDESDRPALRSLVGGSIGISIPGGDTISFVVEAPVEPVPPAAESKPAQKYVARPWRGSIEPKQPTWGPELTMVLIPLGVLTAMILIFRTARRPRRLSEAQRTEFAVKLQRAVAQRDGHAAT